MMKLVLVCLLGITGADTLDALAGGTQSGAAEKGREYCFLKDKHGCLQKMANSKLNRIHVLMLL